MSRGSARRERFDNLGAFAGHIASLDSNEAIALGALRAGLPDQVQIATKQALEKLNGAAGPEMIARTGDHIAYEAGRPALVLVDIDTKGMPATVAARIKDLGGFWQALASVVPELADTGRVVRKSTTTGITRADTGEALPGSNGRHIFLLARDGGDAERFLRTLHDRCWLAGFGWMMVGAGGQLLERSIVDRMVFAPERLVFEGAPVLVSSSKTRRVGKRRRSRARPWTRYRPVRPSALSNRPDWQSCVQRTRTGLPPTEPRPAKRSLPGRPRASPNGPASLPKQPAT